MSVSLLQVGTLAQDLFYQDYAPRDAFFDIKDFKSHFAQAYAEMLDDMFQKLRKEGKREEGFANVEMSAAWLVKEEIEVLAEESEPFFYAKTTSCIYSFNWDKFAYALDSLRPLGNCNGGIPCRVQKISPEEAAYLDISPTTSLVYFWLAAENKIMFTSPLAGKVTVSYIPSVDEENDACVLSSSIARKAIRMTLDLMFASKNGNVVDESNDGNKNSTAQNQANPQLTKTQQNA